MRQELPSLPFTCSQQLMVEINFLCVHKKLRSKRVAPVLIKEITRRVNQENIFQAVYTAGVLLPKPVAVCRLSLCLNLLCTSTYLTFCFSSPPLSATSSSPFFLSSIFLSVSTPPPCTHSFTIFSFLSSSFLPPFLSSFFFLSSSLPPRYWHRSLNPKKLVEVQFSSLHRNMTLQRMIRLYRLPEVANLLSILSSTCIYVLQTKLTSNLAVY